MHEGVVIVGGIYQADVEEDTWHGFKHDGQASKNLAKGSCYGCRVEQVGV